MKFPARDPWKGQTALDMIRALRLIACDVIQHKDMDPDTEKSLKRVEDALNEAETFEIIAEKRQKDLSNGSAPFWGAT